MSLLSRYGRALLLAAALGVAAPSLSACKASPAAEAEKPISPLETLTIRTARGEVKFQVEIADDDAERQHGLMDRKSLAPDRGMLFDFEEEREQAFWMKNTLIPLDIIYIAEDGTIVSIAAMTTPMSEQSIPSNGPASGVLEIAGGRAGELGLAPGDKVTHRIFTGG
ncbi:DUF192 domain-containing protein [Caulobacter sp. SLTY]|uniref:DUF192 domain-containing protein n=1 Tax=Caulobacter sp. SLTY TaxID=2683262 RepID=UPI00141274A3|nr:DUF192 domain-containing protein [Caulobacter sp. SLTY]